jgi:prolipoprotein diacylglyceryltransferase
MAVTAIGLIVLRSNRAFDGAWFGLFAALYAGSRLFIEAFRGDSETMGGLRTAQIWSLIALLIALVLLRRWAQAAAPESPA